MKKERFYPSNNNMDAAIIKLTLALCFLAGFCDCYDLVFKRDPAPDGHRCGVCPTYYRKICAFNLKINATYIFDNHCVMDLYNCVEDSEFAPIEYEKCLYFGNFAYVHGFKYEDLDYKDQFVATHSKKNPDFVPFDVQRKK